MSAVYSSWARRGPACHTLLPSMMTVQCESHFVKGEGPTVHTISLHSYQCAFHLHLIPHLNYTFKGIFGTV